VLVRVLGVAGAGILSISRTRQEQGGRGGGASLDGGSRVEGEGEPTASLLHFGVRPTSSLLHNTLLTEGSPGSLRAVEVDLPPPYIIPLVQTGIMMMALGIILLAAIVLVRHQAEEVVREELQRQGIMHVILLK